MTTLLPCPFCGSTKVGVGASQEEVPLQWSVLCGGCGSSCSLYCETEQNAIEAWNTRIQPQQMRDAIELTEDMLEAGAQALADDVWHPPIKLSLMAKHEASKFRRQALITLKAATAFSRPDDPPQRVPADDWIDQNYQIDRYGVALMMIREGCSDPAGRARRVLSEFDGSAHTRPECGDGS